MLQVARLAPKQLGESRDLVAAFLRSHTNTDGGFQDRAGASDLYYTVFGLDALIALQEDVSAEQTAAYLRACDPASLDFAHAACLARAWAAIRRSPDPDVIQQILTRIEASRSGDGGYAVSAGAPHGTAYAAFLALGAYQDFGRALPEPDRVVASIRQLRAADGGYANQPGLTSGITPATAAAIMVLRQLGEQPARDAGMWLLDRC